MRKSTKHKILFFFLVLIGLIAGYTALYISVSRFNEKERTMPVLSSQTETKGKDESVAIKPRGGSTDSWVKRWQPHPVGKMSTKAPFTMW